MVIPLFCGFLVWLVFVSCVLDFGFGSGWLFVHRMGWSGRDVEDHPAPPTLQWAGTPFPRPGCSKPHPALPKFHAGYRGGTDTYQEFMLKKMVKSRSVSCVLRKRGVHAVNLSGKSRPK